MADSHSFQVLNCAMVMPFLPICIGRSVERHDFARVSHLGNLDDF